MKCKRSSIDESISLVFNENLVFLNFGYKIEGSGKKTVEIRILREISDVLWDFENFSTLILNLGDQIKIFSNQNLKMASERKIDVDIFPLDRST